MLPQLIRHPELLKESGSFYELEYCITAMPEGYHNGYVAVSHDHPLCGYRSTSDLTQLEVHGGITYSNIGITLTETSEFTSVTSEEWWFGFDCCGITDLLDESLMSPSYLQYYTRQLDLGSGRVSSMKEMLTRASKVIYPKASFKDIEFVRKQCANLAKQLSAIKQNSNLDKGDQDV